VNLVAGGTTVKRVRFENWNDESSELTPEAIRSTFRAAYTGSTPKHNPARLGC